MGARTRRHQFAATALALVFGLLAAAGCLQVSDSVVEGVSARGATNEVILTPDGVELQARLWPEDRRRMVIFLHEYRDTQASWWTHTERQQIRAAARLTFDFRGHGETIGDIEDIPGMVEDVRAAVTWSREHGYEQIVLVGAGMGGAIAIIIAAEEDLRGVVALSAPSEFDILEPLAAAPLLGDRLTLMAAEGDLSAAHSLHVFREATGLGITRAPMYPGRAHGVAMLFGRAGADVRTFFRRSIDRLWQG